MSLSLIWFVFLCFSFLSSVFNGKISDLTAAALDGAAQGVQTTLSIAGALCLWSALSRAMEKNGMTKFLQRLLRPFLRKLFPDSAEDEEAFGAICTNFAANLLGLGNAATPAGIRAVRRMKGRSGLPMPTDEMCRLIVMNTASIQLLPTTVAAIRAAAGALRPFDILPAVWASSVLSVSVGLLVGEALRRLRW